MELNLEPMNPKPFFEGEGGSFHKWFPSDFPMIAQTKVAAGRLLLHPRAFAVPHNSDSSKVGYVLQGNGIAGLLFPGKSGETVVKLKKGDLIPVPEGVTSWWFNPGNDDSDFEILLVGDSSNALIPGDVTYVVFAGPLGILQSFPPEYVAGSYSLNEEESAALLRSQSNGLIFKLRPDQTLPEPDEGSALVFNIYDAVPDARVEAGGTVTAVTEEKFPFIGKSGLTAVLEKLEANAVRAPIYVADPSVQLIYVSRGSGRIMVGGFLGKMDSEVKAGQLVLVPKYFAVGKVAGDEGMECFSIITTTRPLEEELGGKDSIFGSLSAQVFQASFNITAEFEKLLRSKITKASPLAPPFNHHSKH